MSLTCGCDRSTQLAHDGAGCDDPAVVTASDATAAAPSASFAVPFSTSTPHPELGAE